MSCKVKDKYERIPQQIQCDIRLLSFKSYEDYMNSFLSKTELEMLSLSPARTLVGFGLGYSVTLTEKEFKKRVQRVLDYFKPYRTKLPLCHVGIQHYPGPMIEALAKREEDNINGKIATIIFLRDFNHMGHEVSAYIDYRHRLTTSNWLKYFKGHKKLMPKTTDLCHYNWKNRQVTFHDTDNFLVKSHKDKGLIFVCIHDNKIICPYELTVCTERREIKTPKHQQAVLYDHVIMKLIDLSKF